MAPTQILSKATLSQFTGTTTWFRHGLIRDVLYTEGVQYLAEAGSAFWLIDEIAFAQHYEKAVAAEPFQLWKLTVHPDCSSLLNCDDGNSQVVFSKAIPYSDFPLDEISLYFTDHVILLPSEY